MSNYATIILFMVLVFVAGAIFQWTVSINIIKGIEQDAQNKVTNWSVSKCQGYLEVLRELNSSIGPDIYTRPYNVIIIDNITFPWDKP